MVNIHTYYSAAQGGDPETFLQQIFGFWQLITIFKTKYFFHDWSGDDVVAKLWLGF